MPVDPLCDASQLRGVRKAHESSVVSWLAEGHQDGSCCGKDTDSPQRAFVLGSSPA
jgi:hypothetical protein